MRPRGGVRSEITDGEIVRLRDVERMAWADMTDLTGLTDGTLKTRHEAATARPHRRIWNRSTDQHPDLSRARLTELNGVIDHKGQIVESYLSGQASAMELSRTWGISDTTVRRWAARAQTDPKPGLAAEPEWVIGEAQRELEAWTPRRRAGPDSQWCTPTEAAEILHLSPERVRQLSYDSGVLPTWVAAGGKRLLRRTDVHTAARLAGEPGSVHRWDAARAALGTSRPAPPDSRSGRCFDSITDHH